MAVDLGHGLGNWVFSAQNMSASARAAFAALLKFTQPLLSTMMHCSMLFMLTIVHCIVLTLLLMRLVLRLTAHIDLQQNE